MGDVDSAFGRRIGGRLCLDFVNTVSGWAGSGDRRGRDFADRIVRERLTSYDALLRWSRFAGVLTAREVARLAGEASARPSDAAAVLQRTHLLRGAIYRLIKAALEGWKPRPEDVAALNRELRIARAHERLSASPAFTWEWDDTDTALDRMLWPIVRSAVELLTSPDLERVGQCQGDQCGWVFVDTSRSRRRQWCHMADCGTLAKVRRFRERQASQDRRPSVGRRADGGSR